jgi:predicted aconitase with swiveling domain
MNQTEFAERLKKTGVVTPGKVTAEAVVTTEGFNTLASLQMALQFGDKEVKCGDQSNTQLYGKSLIGKALCLPQTIGSTTGGLVLYCACSMKMNPACMLFANHIDSLAAAGAVLADVWVDGVTMPVVDSLGEEFLEFVEDGMMISVGADGRVIVE